MPTGDSSDLFMFLMQDTVGLPGESTAQLKVPGRPVNPLANDFDPGAMFELSAFDFGVGVGQEALERMEYPGQAKSGHGGAALPASSRRTALPPRQKTRPGQSREESPVTIQPITFKRSMDQASQLLLHHTIKRTLFKRAAIVKRKSAGGPAAGEAFLRLDFRDVLLVEASWSDEEVEENYSFHARAITVRYRPQKPDGSLGAIMHGFWSMVPNAKEVPL